MFKGKRVIGIAAAAALCITALMGTMVIFAQERAEQRVEKQQEQEIPEYVVVTNDLGSESEDLYKNSPYGDPEILKAVCQKYGLDYDTVTREEITGEMVDYETALWLKKKMADRPVLGDSEWGDPELSTLEVQIDEIHAFGGAKPIIEEVCRQAGLDPETAVVGDLTERQLMDIMEKAFETSDHGK